MMTRKALRATISELTTRINDMEQELDYLHRQVSVLSHPATELPTVHPTPAIKSDSMAEAVERITRRGLSNEQRCILEAFAHVYYPATRNEVLDAIGVKRTSGDMSRLLHAGLLIKVGKKGTAGTYMVSAKGYEALSKVAS